MKNDFLPIIPAEMQARGWEQPDFVYVTGDAYVDHPSFGAAIITRLLESQGFKVVVLSQPDWHSARDFRQFGRPKYAFLITAGNIDSMVAHYTAAKKLRHDDAYTAGGKHGKRPDRAVNVYTRLAKEAYPDCPPPARGPVGGQYARYSGHYVCGAHQGHTLWRGGVPLL